MQRNDERKNGIFAKQNDHAIVYLAQLSNYNTVKLKCSDIERGDESIWNITLVFALDECVCEYSCR